MNLRLVVFLYRDFRIYSIYKDLALHPFLQVIQLIAG